MMCADSIVKNPNDSRNANKLPINTNRSISETPVTITFSNSVGWEYTPAPKEIDIQQYDGPVKTYLNEYVSYLQNLTGDTNLDGTLITLNELKGLGCTINDSYTYESGLTCANSEYKNWLVNGTLWWTRSAISTDANDIWVVCKSGTLSYDNHGPYYGSNTIGIRPVIIISKSILLS